jgi:hypothetical protein
MKTELQRLFFEATQKNLDFLLAEGRFKGSYPQLDAKTGIFTVVYMGTNLAVELILDERDEDISCKISRVINGAPALDYAIDGHGKLVRASLYRLIDAHGVQNQLLTSLKGLTFKDRIPILLEGYAKMLKAYAQMVLDDNPEFLDIAQRAEQH